jgi:tight adherence protein C
MNIIESYLYQLQANAEYFAVLALVFLAAAILAGGGFFLLMRQQLLSRRLASMIHPETASRRPETPRLLEQEGTGLLTRISEPLSKLHQPKEEAEIRKNRLKLIQAGLRTKKAHRYFLATKAFFPIFLAGAYLFQTSFYKFTTTEISICLLLFAAGFYLPDLFLRHLTAKRQEGMRKALPEALDLMVVCTEAGLGLDMTFKRVGDEIKDINKDLSDEFHLTNLEIRAGKIRVDSFRNMALRTGIPEISNLMTMLIQTSRFGTSVADALRVHAESMRTKRQQTAEEKAAKMAVKIVFPLIVFILPALFIVLVGPAGLQIMKTLLPALGGG